MKPYHMTAVHTVEVHVLEQLLVGHMNSGHNYTLLAGRRNSATR